VGKENLPKEGEKRGKKTGGIPKGGGGESGILLSGRGDLFGNWGGKVPIWMTGWKKGGTFPEGKGKGEA